MVTASQFGHRSPSGRIQKKTRVAAMMRSTKKPPNTRTKITPSDMRPSFPRARPDGEHGAPGRGRTGTSGSGDAPATGLQALLHECPPLHVGHSGFNALDDDFGPQLDGRVVEAAGLADDTGATGIVLDGTGGVHTNGTHDAGRRSLKEVALIHHLLAGTRDGPLEDQGGHADGEQGAEEGGDHHLGDGAKGGVAGDGVPDVAGALRSTPTSMARTPKSRPRRNEAR